MKRKIGIIDIEIDEDAFLNFEVKRMRRNLGCFMYIKLQIGKKQHKLFLSKEGSLRHEEIE